MKREVGYMISAVIGGVVGSAITRYIISRAGDNKAIENDKNRELFLLMNQWVNVKQSGKNIADYLQHYGYKRIAIYGMSYVGKTLLRELQNSTVKVLYGIDKRAERMYADLKMVSVEADLEEVDAVIVTAIAFFDEIEETLSRKLKCPIICLSEILDEM